MLAHKHDASLLLSGINLQDGVLMSQTSEASSGMQHSVLAVGPPSLP